MCGSISAFHVFSRWRVDGVDGVGGYRDVYQQVWEGSVKRAKLTNALEKVNEK